MASLVAAEAAPEVAEMAEAELLPMAERYLARNPKAKAFAESAANVAMLQQQYRGYSQPPQYRQQGPPQMGYSPQYRQPGPQMGYSQYPPPDHMHIGSFEKKIIIFTIIFVIIGVVILIIMRIRT